MLFAHVGDMSDGIGTAWVFGISALAVLNTTRVIPVIREVAPRTTKVPVAAVHKTAVTAAAAEGLTEPDAYLTAALPAQTAKPVLVGY